MMIVTALTAFGPVGAGGSSLAAETVSSALAGFGLGIALAGAPGPVQAVILAESLRGGISRGFRVMAGANLTFAALLVSLALGLSVAPPSGPLVRGLKIVGGAFLLWLAIDAFRSVQQVDGESVQRGALPPAARGAIAVVVNPGVWLFLATAASSLLLTAAHMGGRAAPIAAALGLSAGLAAGDCTVVLIGGLGVRRAGERTGLWVQRTLAVALAGLGIWLVINGFIS